MIDYDEIRREIDNLEHSKTTLQNCERLAILYQVMDHLNETGPKIPKQPQQYSYDSAPRSEFVEAAQGIDPDALLTALDEHMQSVLVLYPREYAAVISRLKKLRGT